MDPPFVLLGEGIVPHRDGRPRRTQRITSVKGVLHKHLPEPDRNNLRIRLIDEKAVRRRHGYVTRVMNGESGELLHMAEGKKKQSLQSFFDKLTDGQKASIQAVAMDRAGAYPQVVEKALPAAKIVFDKFHLIANYNEVIDEVRRAVSQLPERERMAVHVHYLCGEPVEAARGALGLSPSGFYKLLERARRRLRAKLLKTEGKR